MVTDAELIFWLVVGGLAILAFIIVCIIAHKEGDMYVPEETIRRIENGGRHL